MKAKPSVKAHFLGEHPVSKSTNLISPANEDNGIPDKMKIKYNNNNKH